MAICGLTLTAEAAVCPACSSESGDILDRHHRAFGIKYLCKNWMSSLHIYLHLNTVCPGLEIHSDQCMTNTLTQRMDSCLLV